MCDGLSEHHRCWSHTQSRTEGDGTYKAVVNIFAINRTSPPSSIKIPGHRGKEFRRKINTDAVSQTRAHETPND
jgi:hypothetical protein